MKALLGEGGVDVEDNKSAASGASGSSRSTGSVVSVLSNLLDRDRLLHVGIVEDHCDCVPFLYALIRKKIIRDAPVLLHVDAHPDLSLPSSPPLQNQALARSSYPPSFASSSLLPSFPCSSRNSVKSWKDAETLCDLLSSSEGAIAEWILPLVYNQFLAERVIWIHPNWSDQFGAPEDNKEIEFFIGDVFENGVEVAVVSSEESYYSIEGVARQEGQLLETTPRRRCCLICQTVQKEMDLSLLLTQQQPWILDICLDYFITVNPFLDPLQEMIREDLIQHPTTTKTADVITKDLQMIYIHIASLKGNAASQAICEFHQILKNGQIIMDDIKTHNFLSQFDKASSCIISFLLSSLPLLSQVTREFIVDAGHCLLLPHHESSESEMDQLLQELKQCLLQVQHPPVCIIVARSSTDDYTPSKYVDSLQERVLQIISEVSYEVWDGRNDGGREKWKEGGGEEGSERGISNKRKRVERSQQRTNQLQLLVHDLYKEEDPWATCHTLFTYNSKMLNSHPYPK